IEGIQGFFHRLMGNDPAQLRGKDLSTPELTPEQKARLGKWQGAYGMKTSMNENKGIESLLADIKDELHGKLFTAYAS
ncbi:MAG: hypothetical protein FWE67_14535, partial [Planctomycetaceae bacterium]|nr:hypothetical protein [Planctomycetaceae bacterium]